MNPSAAFLGGSSKDGKFQAMPAGSRVARVPAASMGGEGVLGVSWHFQNAIEVAAVAAV